MSTRHSIIRTHATILRQLETTLSTATNGEQKQIATRILNLRSKLRIILRRSE